MVSRLICFGRRVAALSRPRLGLVGDFCGPASLLSRHGYRCISFSPGDEIEAPVLREYLLNGNFSESMWVSVATEVSRPMRNTVILAMLERGLHTFSLRTVEEVMMCCAKTLLTDQRVKASTGSQDVATHAASGMASHDCSAFCLLVQQLPAYLNSCKANTVSQTGNVLWAALTVCPHVSGQLVRFFVDMFSGSVTHVKLEYAVYLCEALQRNVSVCPEGVPLLALLVQSFDGRVDHLIPEQMFVVMHSCCAIPESDAARMFCRSMDTCLSSLVADLDSDKLSQLCFGYGTCSHATSLPVALLIERHLSSMKSSDVRVALRYLASFAPQQVTSDVLTRLGERVVGERSTTDLLFSLRSIAMLSDRAELRSTCDSLLERALATVQSRVYDYAAHHLVQLLEFLVQAGAASKGQLLNELAMLAMSKSKKLSDVSHINLLYAIAFVAESHTTYSLGDDRALEVHHAVQPAHCHACYWSLTLPSSVFSKRLDVLPKLCYAVRGLRAADSSSMLHDALRAAEQCFARCSVDFVPASLHHLAYTLAVFDFPPAHTFLEQYCAFIIRLTAAWTRIQFHMHHSGGDLVLSLLAAYYSTVLVLEPSTSDLAQIKWRQQEMKKVFLKVQTLAVPPHVMPELLAMDPPSAPLPQALREALRSCVGDDSMLLDKRTTSGIVVPAVVCVDRDGQAVSKEIMTGAAGLMLSQADFIGADVHAVAVLLFSARYFAVKADTPGRLLLDADHALGYPLLCMAELTALGYTPLCLVLEQVALASVSESQVLFQESLAKVLASSASSS